MDHIIIRDVNPDDAPNFNVYRRQMADEPNNFIDYSAGEYKRTVEEEKQRLRDTLIKPVQISLVAVDNGKIIGACSCVGVDNPSLKHTVRLGMGIIPNYRQQGLGSQFMEQMLAWARSHPIVHRVELDVLANNHRAIGLYLKYGFKIEGRKDNAYFKYGEYIDSYLMALWV